MLEVVSVLLHPACLCNLLFHVSSLHRQPQRLKAEIRMPSSLASYRLFYTSEGAETADSSMCV